MSANKLKIGRRTYKVTFEKAPLLNDKSCRGYYMPDSKQIVLKRGMDKIEREETLIHEVLHGIEEEYNLKISHALIHELEKPLAAYIRSNYVRKTSRN